jgi:hypothetical protein
VIKVLIYAVEVLLVSYFLVEVAIPFLSGKPYFPATRSLFSNNRKVK